MMRHTSNTILLKKFAPLSLNKVSGQPCSHSTWSKNALATADAPIDFNGIKMDHLVQWSVKQSTYLLPEDVIGNGRKISALTRAKGPGTFMVASGASTLCL